MFILVTPFSKNLIFKEVPEQKDALNPPHYSNSAFSHIQDWGGAKRPPPFTSFLPVTSTNVRISPKNVLDFSFKLFATLL